MFFTKMKGGVLEVLLVSAEHINHAHHLLGSSNHYVIIRCGNQTHRSKITTGEDRTAWWNEKFIFKLSSSECRYLTHLKLRIMEKEKLLEDWFIGETIVHLRGMLIEGTRKGHLELKPSKYNIVLNDGTYAGELKIGLKFISGISRSNYQAYESNIMKFIGIMADVEQQTEGRGCRIPEKEPKSIYARIFKFNLKRVPWRKFFFFLKKSNPSENKKEE